VRKFKQQGGNDVVNEIYEAKMPRNVKPNANTDIYEVEKFVRNKYEHKLWYSPKKEKKSRKKPQLEENDSSGGSYSSDLENDKPKPRVSKPVAPQSNPKTPPQPVSSPPSGYVAADHKQLESQNGLAEWAKFDNEAEKSKPQEQIAPQPAEDFLDFSDMVVEAPKNDALFMNGEVMPEPAADPSADPKKIEASKNNILAKFKQKPQPAPFVPQLPTFHQIPPVQYMQYPQSNNYQQMLGGTFYAPPPMMAVPNGVQMGFYNQVQRQQPEFVHSYGYTKQNTPQQPWQWNWHSKMYDTIYLS